MVHYRQVGEVPQKRHTQFRRPDGGLYAEELMSVGGFSGPSTLLYHENPPTMVESAEGRPRPDANLLHPTVLAPHHLRASIARSGDMVTGRRLLLGNDDVRVHVVHAQGESGMFRNALGDELVFIRTGSAVLESVFGSLHVSEGDYVVVPRSTTHRWITAGPVEALIIETTGHVDVPSRYLSSTGQFLEHSPYCERDLHAPTAPLIVEEYGIFEVTVRHVGGHTVYHYANHPFDVVGWAGCVYPYRLNIADFEPITGRIHQPPPVHQTFQAPGVVICSFVPRKLDYHPDAIPAPYNHSNVDSDELLYYVEGEFASRRGAGIGPGSITWHPAGFTHGPQPGSVEASIGAESSDEVAVMIDTFKPLAASPDALAIDDHAYLQSWLP